MSTFLNLPNPFAYNISLYSLPIVWMHAFSAHEIKLLRLGTRYNNNKPRDPVTFRKEDSEEYKQKIETLGGIHHNGIESFPLFATAVLSLNLAKLPIPYINSFVLFYVASRLLYNLIYYLQAGFVMDTTRTVVYVGGMVSCLWVIWQSAVAYA